MSTLRYSLNANMLLIVVRIQHLKLHAFKGCTKVSTQPRHTRREQSRVAEFKSHNYKYIYQKSFYF